MTVFSASGGKATSMPVGFFLGGVASLAVTIVTSGILAWLVISQKLPENQIGYGVMVLLALASFSGAKVSYRKIKRQRLVVSMVAGAIYFGILLSMTALFFGGQYNAVGESALMVLCGCALAFLLKKGEKISMKSGKRRKGYR